MYPRTPRQCLDKAKDLIGLALPETDDARREGLLRMADEWVAMAHRHARDLPANRLGACRPFLNDPVPA